MQRPGGAPGRLLCWYSSLPSNQVGGGAGRFEPPCRTEGTVQIRKLLMVFLSLGIALSAAGVVMAFFLERNLIAVEDAQLGTPEQGS